jgi:Beta-lactamase enzyme family
MTKAMLLVAVLRHAANRPLSVHEDELLRPMITRSSNKAAREVYAAYGDAALVGVARAARMTHFLPVGALFESRITAADQARFFLRIDRLVPSRHRAYARELLGGIVKPQRWGIAPAAERRGFHVYFKGGWRKGITHQAALLERDDRRVALAVLTSDGPSVAYGRVTLRGVAARVLNP